MSILTLDCGHTIDTNDLGHTRGYGIDENNKKICYGCCAEKDKQYMLNNGKIKLYLVQRGKWQYKPNDNVSTWNITNWPNSLSFPVIWYEIGGHNFAGIRYDIWFVGPDDHIWHGVQYGENTELCHCKRTKRTRTVS